MTRNKLHLIGCASGLGGADLHSGDGPLAMQASSYLKPLLQEHLIQWDAMLQPDQASGRRDEKIRFICERLSQLVSENLQKHKRTCVIGGDHSCALGTWSGVYEAYHQQGDIGLIWFDAHMDAHTPETTPSGHIHGMPVAALLGFGYPTLTSISKNAPKFKPQNVCYIGVRSYESGEAELLKKLNVKIYYMEEVLRRGFQEILQEAIYHVTQHTVGYGLSLDLDGIDPKDAPGVDVPEPNGVRAEDLMLALPMITNDPRLLLTEIVEFDPTRDRDRMTEKLFAALIEILVGR